MVCTPARVSVEESILIPPAADLLISPKGENHGKQNKLCLANWQVSTDLSKQQKQANFSHSLSDDQIITPFTNSAWDKQRSCILQRVHGPYQASMAIVADYLSNRFDKGDQYRTINSHRCAISAFHVQVDGVKVGQHDLVKDEMKCILRASPHPNMNRNMFGMWM